MNIDPEHEATDLVTTEAKKPMSDPKLGAVIPRREALGSKDREVASFVATRLSGWNARSAGDYSAQLSGRDGLTARERDVLVMISQGLSNKRIARALDISPETVKSHVKHIFSKLEVSTRSEAVFRVLSHELS
jgi:DNA-binding CsgD family transcriptional regulator